MIDVSELARFTPGERTLRLVMDIAAALERYRIAMEGPAGVRRRKTLGEGRAVKVVRKGGPMNDQTRQTRQPGQPGLLGRTGLAGQPGLTGQASLVGLGCLGCLVSR